MKLDNYIERISECNSDEEKVAVANHFLNTQTKEERNDFLLEMDIKVDAIKNRLIEIRDFQGSVVTVKDYCKQRQVSRQYVYQEIKSGKFKTIELPIFTEYKGKRVAVGTQKFLSF